MIALFSITLAIEFLIGCYVIHATRKQALTARLYAYSQAILLFIGIIAMGVSISFLANR